MLDHASLRAFLVLAYNALGSYAHRRRAAIRRAREAAAGLHAASAEPVAFIVRGAVIRRRRALWLDHLAVDPRRPCSPPTRLVAGAHRRRHWGRDRPPRRPPQPAACLPPDPHGLGRFTVTRTKKQAFLVPAGWGDAAGFPSEARLADRIPAFSPPPHPWSRIAVRPQRPFLRFVPISPISADVRPLHAPSRHGARSFPARARHARRLLAERLPCRCRG